VVSKGRQEQNPTARIKDSSYMKIHPELKKIAKSMKILHRDGVIRSKNLVGELGEYYCKELFNLEMHHNIVNEGFDGYDVDRNKVEIKTRRTPEGKSKVIFRGFTFSYCLFVELNEFYEPVLILKME